MILAKWCGPSPTRRRTINQIYSSTREQLTTDATDHRSPSVNNRGDVVWEQYDGVNNQIYGYINGSFIQITSDNTSHSDPSINDNGEVVWSQYDNTLGTKQIYSSLRGGLTNDSNEHSGPSINNNGDVVWSRYDGWSQNEGPIEQIHGIINGAIVQITTESGWHIQPSINDSGEVIWNQYNGIYSNTRGRLSGSCPDGMYEDPDINNCGDIVFTSNKDGDNAVYRLGSNSPCGNETEPNNGQVEATTIPGNGTLKTGSVNSGTDMEDWYSFTANAGDQINISVSWDQTSGNMGVDLTDGSSTVLATAGQSGTPKTISYTATYNGTHYVRLTAIGGRTGYALSVNVLDITAPIVSLSSPSSGITNDDTPTLSYATEAGATIVVTVDGTMVATGNNQELAVLADGQHIVWIEATDAAGNTGSAEVFFTVDTTAPAVAINPATSPTNQTSQTITGSVENGATVTVTVTAPASVGAVSYPAPGTWSCSITGMAEGVTAITVTATDAASNSSQASASIAADLTVPVIAINPVASPTNQTSQTITGTMENGAIITVSAASPATVGAVSYPTGGTWSCMIAGMTEGVTAITVAATDAANNSAEASATINLDVTAPAVSITSPAAGITNDNTPTLSFTTEPGTTVVVKVDGAVVATDNTQALAALFDGPHTVRVEATDAAGNTGFTEVAFTVDTVAPAVSINPVISPTNQTSQTITGTMENGAEITVTTAAPASVDTATYPTAGTWSCAVSGMIEGITTITVTATDAAGNSAQINATIMGDVTAPAVSINSPVAGITNDSTPTLSYATEPEAAVVVKVDGAVVVTGNNQALAALTDGEHTIRVEATDTAGNTGFAVVTFTVDTVAPAVAIDPVTTPTNQTSQTITGTVENGSVVTVSATAPASAGTVSYPTAGTWSSVITGMAEGATTITATATDAAGNSAQTNATITVDVTVPAVSINSPVAGITNDSTPTLSYATEPEAAVVVKVDGAVVVTGNNQALAALTDGEHTIRVEATDAAGNSGFAVVTLTVDTVAPAVAIDPVTTPTNQTSQTITGTVENGSVVTVSATAPASAGTVSYPTAGTWSSVITGMAEGATTITVTATDSAANSGQANVMITVDLTAPAVSIASPAAGITNDATPALSYATEAEATVVVKVDGIVVATGNNQPLSTLSDGEHSVRVEATDPAGNIGSSEVMFTVDTTAPAVAINPVSSPTNQMIQTITGTVENGSVVTVSATAPASAGTVSYPTAGTWSSTITDMAEGVTAITATATDVANNSGQANAMITVDLTAPAVSIASPAAGITNDNTPTLSYTADAQATVVVKVDGTVVAIGNNQALSALSDGQHTIRVEATDSAGNMGFGEAIVTIDTTPPTISINPVNTPTKYSSQTITGNREINSSVTVTANTSAAIGSVSYPTSTTWRCTISNMPRGTNGITAVAKDGANNTASAQASIYVR